jgi:hypothetical protein
MKSKTRQDCETAEAIFAGMLSSLQHDIKNPKMLMIGTAGNPLTHNGKPGLDRPELFKRYQLTTMDFDPKWRPDIVADLTAKDLPYNTIGTYDLIHITQVLEHIPNLFDVSDGLRYLLKKDGYVIIDSPWGPKGPDWHGEPPSFGDYWRISKDGMRALFEKQYEIIEIIATDANTSCLMKVK